MRHLLTVSAVALLMGAPAWAQTGTEPMVGGSPQDRSGVTTSRPADCLPNDPRAECQIGALPLDPAEDRAPGFGGEAGDQTAEGVDDGLDDGSDTGLGDTGLGGSDDQSAATGEDGGTAGTAGDAGGTGGAGGGTGSAGGGGSGGSSGGSSGGGGGG